MRQIFSLMLNFFYALTRNVWSNKTRIIEIFYHLSTSKVWSCFHIFRRFFFFFFFLISVLYCSYQNLNQWRLYQRNQTNVKNILRDLLQKTNKQTNKQTKKLASFCASQIVRLNGNMVISPLLNLSNDSTKLCNPSRNSVSLWFGIL